MFLTSPIPSCRERLDPPFRAQNLAAFSSLRLCHLDHIDAGRSLEEIDSWLARQSLTDLEQDVCFILTRHKLSRRSEAVERYLASVEAGIGG
jgi:hypothetical protein